MTCAYTWTCTCVSALPSGCRPACATSSFAFGTGASREIKCLLCQQCQQERLKRSLLLCSLPQPLTSLFLGHKERTWQSKRQRRTVFAD